jgi:hypothetical protein
MTQLVAHPEGSDAARRAGPSEAEYAGQIETIPPVALGSGWGTM